MTSSASVRTGTVLTLVATLGFAAVSTLTTLAVAQQVSIWTVLTWRYVMSFAVMAVWIMSQRYTPIPRPEVLRFVVLGGGGQALVVGLALDSLQYFPIAPVATLSSLFFTFPAWVTLVQAVRRAERLTITRCSALALSMSGIAVIVFQLANGERRAVLHGRARCGRACAASDRQRGSWWRTNRLRTLVLLQFARAG